MISAFCIEITADFCYIFFDYFRKNITFAIDNYLLREYNNIHHAKSLVIIIFFEKTSKKGLTRGKRGGILTKLSRKAAAGSLKIEQQRDKYKRLRKFF